MNAVLQIYIRNGQLLRLSGLIDNNGQAVTGATVTADILDKDNAVMSTYSLSDDPSEAGAYLRRIDAGIDIAPGYYNVRVKADKNGVAYEATKRVKVSERKLA